MNEQNKLNVVVVGATGRMGRLVCESIGESDVLNLVGAIEGASSASLGSPAPGPAGSGGRSIAISKDFSGAANLVIDFSTAEGAARAIDIAARCGAALVEATTALPPKIGDRLDALARLVPVLVTSNTSLGVAVTAALVEQAARTLGASFDIDIVESHHRLKRDSPSGTALALAAAAARGGTTINRDHMHSLRGGDVVGEHTIRFAGDGEYIEIRHVATTRKLFALGAIRAGRWLVGQPAGRYGMDDLLLAAR